MTDIVVRLRRWSDSSRGSLMRDAADEIEKLRKELAMCRSVADCLATAVHLRPMDERLMSPEEQAARADKQYFQIDD